MVTMHLVRLFIFSCKLYVIASCGLNWQFQQAEGIPFKLDFEGCRSFQKNLQFSSVYHSVFNLVNSFKDRKEKI